MRPLYEQYRPSSWPEIVGQDSAVRRIGVLQRRGLAGNAYWITGGTGTGKTTIARLIARECADRWAVVEIDASKLTPVALAEIVEHGRYAAFGKGRAYIVNEAHRLTPKVIAQLLVVLEAIPASTVWLFTTTNEAQADLFDSRIDSSPLLSRCLQIPLARRNLSKPFAERCREIACKEGLNGRPIQAYLRLAQVNRNNMRAMLQAVASGDMLAGRRA